MQIKNKHERDENFDSCMLPTSLTIWQNLSAPSDSQQQNSRCGIGGSILLQKFRNIQKQRQNLSDFQNIEKKVNDNLSVHAIGELRKRF